MNIEQLINERDKFNIKGFCIFDEQPFSYCLNKDENGNYIIFDCLNNNEKKNIQIFDNEEKACDVFYQKMKCIYQLRYGNKKNKRS